MSPTSAPQSYRRARQPRSLMPCVDTVRRSSPSPRGPDPRGHPRRRARPSAPPSRTARNAGDRSRPRGRPPPWPPPGRSRSSRPRSAARRRPTRTQEAGPVLVTHPTQEVHVATYGGRSLLPVLGYRRDRRRAGAPPGDAENLREGLEEDDSPLRGSSSRPRNATVGPGASTRAAERLGEARTAEAVRDDDRLAADVLHQGGPSGL